MEHIIKNHLIKYETLPIIFSINSKISVEKDFLNDILSISFYNSSNRIKWKYEFYPFYLPPSIREKIEMYSIPAVEIDFRKIIRLRRGYSLYWEEGNLIKEEYGDREIEYHGKNKIVIIHGIDYIYDLKGHLEVKGVAYMRDFYKLDPFHDNIKEIAEGNLDIINPNYRVFFYVSDDGKVNVILDLWDSKNRIIKYIKDNPAKLKEEAEKLRKDPRNYVPDIN